MSATSQAVGAPEQATAQAVARPKLDGLRCRPDQLGLSAADTSGGNGRGAKNSGTP